MKKPLTIDRGKGNFLTIGWLSSFEYFSERGEIELCFDPKLKPYLLELQGRFVKADIRYIFKLSSEYSKRIYTMFKQWEKLGKYEVSVEEWQKLLEVPKSMLNYADFKRKVLEVAKNQINENTDLLVDFKEIKTGRKVTGLLWTIGKHVGQQLTFDNVSTATIDTRSQTSWNKAKNAKRAKGEELHQKMQENGFNTVFDLIEAMNEQKR
jgi:plasmid replication initiation protein